jgi:hypothetical protein
MPRVPFPHILTEPKFSNDFSLRFVQPEAVLEGELLLEHSHVQENLKTREMEDVVRVFLIKNIKESRPARGDWSAYETWPLYYSCHGEYMGVFFKSALDQPLYIT